MSAAGHLRSEDQFLCSICVDVFTDPVTTSCGHNFCQSCITQHWDVNAPYQCPVCQEVFNVRPELKINRFTETEAPTAPEYTAPGNCHTPGAPSWGSDLTAGGVTDLSDLTEDHKTHEFVPLREEYEGTKAELQKTEAETQRMILKRRLEETLRGQMEKMKMEAEVKRVQQFAVDVTLDPDTASPWLILSDDGKQVHYGDVKKKLPNNPQRFSVGFCVLGKQSFSSGRFYFEVQVKGKTDWIVGVARESVNRKRDITPSPQDGFWTIWLRNGNKYKALVDPLVNLSLRSGLEKVGVFVDYEEGLVSFYDVDAAALIYSFTGCCFTDKLHPLFNPCFNDGGENSAPLIICPVNQTE